LRKTFTWNIKINKILKLASPIEAFKANNVEISGNLCDYHTYDLEKN
jgi:hypothetical protein